MTTQGKMDDIPDDVLVSDCDDLMQIATQDLVFQRYEKNRFGEICNTDDLIELNKARIPNGTKKQNHWSLNLWNEWRDF